MLSNINLISQFLLVYYVLIIISNNFEGNIVQQKCKLNYNMVIYSIVKPNRLFALQFILKPKSENYQT